MKPFRWRRETKGKGLEPELPFAYQWLMEEPSPRSSRLVFAGALAAAIVVAGVGFLLGRGSVPPTSAVAPTSAPPPVPAPPVLGVLGRADLIAFAAEAADALAAGRNPSSEAAEAVGRRFSVRLPFGCEGPVDEGGNGAMGWRYDEEAEALRIHVAPVTWSAEEWFPSEAVQQVETVEGFWIPRPWTSSEDCPKGADRSAPGANQGSPLGQTLAVGQIFVSGSARGGRRDGEPYQSVIRIAAEDLDLSRGLRLRLSGRIARGSYAKPIWCRQPAGPNQRPICLVAVEWDEVAIENTASGRSLATWHPAGS